MFTIVKSRKRDGEEGWGRGMGKRDGEEGWEREEHWSYKTEHNILRHAKNYTSSLVVLPDPESDMANTTTTTLLKHYTLLELSWELTTSFLAQQLMASSQALTKQRRSC
jgi:hypothetical protein